jgi:hypothetical protein
VPPHLARVGTVLPGALTRLIALSAVGAFGVATLVATTGSPVAGGQQSVAAARVDDAPTRSAPDGRGAHAGAAGVAESSPTRPTPARSPTARRSAEQPKPAAAPAAAAHHTPARPERWLPSGTGMWIYQWHKTGGGNGHAVVDRARRAGLSTLYLRTGSTHDGLSGAAAMTELLDATRGTPVHVVAWDFPELWHPVRDARRLARAARIGRAGDGPRVAAVAPDIETPSEGTYNAAWRVRTYMTALRRHLPPEVTILGTVPWPSRYRIADYPYTAVARHSDALVPMAYWYNNPPAMVTAQSIAYLSRFHKPVQPVGQGYDGKLDVPSLKHNHLAREVPRFLRTARQHGADAVSVWSWQSASPATWRALDRAHGMFAPR